MKLTVHVTLSGDDDDTETVVREVFALTREALTPDTETGKNRGCDVRSHVMSDDVEGVG